MCLLKRTFEHNVGTAVYSANTPQFSYFKADSHGLHLTSVAVVDGCIAAAEIGNFLLFRMHPSTAAARIKCILCESAFT